MDGLALLCNLQAEGPLTLRRLRRAGIRKLGHIQLVPEETLVAILEATPSQVRRFVREARLLSERIYDSERLSEGRAESGEPDELDEERAPRPSTTWIGREAPLPLAPPPVGPAPWGPERTRSAPGPAASTSSGADRPSAPLPYPSMPRTVAQRATGTPRPGDGFRAPAVPSTPATPAAASPLERAGARVPASPPAGRSEPVRTDPPLPLPAQIPPRVERPAVELPSPAPSREAGHRTNPAWAGGAMPPAPKAVPSPGSKPADVPGPLPRPLSREILDPPQEGRPRFWSPAGVAPPPAASPPAASSAPAAASEGTLLRPGLVPGLDAGLIQRLGEAGVRTIEQFVARASLDLARQVAVPFTRLLDLDCQSRMLLAEAEREGRRSRRVVPDRPAPRTAADPAPPADTKVLRPQAPYRAHVPVPGQAPQPGWGRPAGPPPGPSAGEGAGGPFA